MSEKVVRWYLHPINLTQVYLDTSPARRDEFALAPNPGTIGHFDSEVQATMWLEDRVKAGYKTAVELVVI